MQPGRDVPCSHAGVLLLLGHDPAPRHRAKTAETKLGVTSRTAALAAVGARADLLDANKP